MAGFSTLDSSNPQILEEYNKDMGNILVKEHDSDNNKCYIYCSSNNLYKKDDGKDFTDKIVLGNRFEWTNRTAACTPNKEIFIRDIWLSWYSRGINWKINSIDKLVDYLRAETEGYEVYTVGVSSGGYIAAILAAELRAKMCFDFSGQFSLGNHYDHVKKNPFLKEKQAEAYLEAYQIVQEKKSAIFYFLPAGCEQDIVQSKFAAECDNVQTIRFRSSRHGVTVLSVSLPETISMPPEKLMKLAERSRKKAIHPVAFSIEVSGVWRTGKFLARRVFRLITEKVEKSLSKSIKGR